MKDDEEVCTEVSCDSMDASEDNGYSSSIEESNDDAESFYALDTDSLCSDASSCEMGNDMYVDHAHVEPMLVVDDNDEVDLDTSKVAISLDVTDDALGNIMDDAKEQSCRVLLSSMMWKVAIDYALQEMGLCLLSHAFYMAMCVHVSHALVMAPVDGCFMVDDALDWGFDERDVKMDEEMKKYVTRAMTRIDARRDAKKNGCDVVSYDVSRDDMPMNGLESLFDEYEIDFGNVYDADDVYGHMVDDYKPFLFDPGGRCIGYLPLDWATILWPFDPGGWQVL